MRVIQCHINGHSVGLVATRRRLLKERGIWSKQSHRELKTKPGNVWPWRFMERRECVTVPYAMATYDQIVNSVNGYTKHATGAKFSYRSEALGLSVWCVKTRDRKAKK